MYPATIPIFALLTYSLLHLKFSFKKGSDVIKWGYITCSIIIFAFYFYKVFTNKLI